MQLTRIADGGGVEGPVKNGSCEEGPVLVSSPFFSLQFTIRETDGVRLQTSIPGGGGGVDGPVTDHEGCL